ncbi:hypothetical protein B0T19DRAFT_31915 [Cercophora scortea]|uniref:Mid2 domain-containing protein n=1 Tax=Cercophora scortea TaxID=314031 RepID=A0AAE0J3G9_9PEZI|nr:hypothetical protein B0T19DRAFT_31915 [Cercophora scortea]
MHFRLLDLLVVGLSALSVAEAALVDAKAAGKNLGKIQQRQDTSKTDPIVNAVSTTSTPADTVVTSTPPAPTTTPTTTTPVPDVPTSISSSTPTPTTPTPTGPSSTAVPASSSPTTLPSSTTAAPASNTQLSSIPSQSSSPSSNTDTAPVILTVTSVFTKTNSDGSKSTVTSQYTSTSTPALANNGSGQTSGMTTQTRNTVIGVVVGIGGAIILAGLGLVAWRIWGRKKVQEENDGLMDYGNPAEKSEASGSMNGRTPFQSTLESYHAPGSVNTASNF